MNDLYIINKAMKAGATLEQANKFINDVQVMAFMKGATVEQALLFKHYSQVGALESGATPELALKFTNDHYWSLPALRAGVTPEQALKVQSELQVTALKSGTPFEETMNIRSIDMLCAKAIRSHEIEEMCAYYYHNNGCSLDGGYCLHDTLQGQHDNYHNNAYHN